MPQRSIASIASAILLGAAAVGAVLTVRHLGAGRIADGVLAADPAWLAVALALMCLAMAGRAVSWRAILAAALPGSAVRLGAVLRATSIGVLLSATVPGRAGEPARAMVMTRHLPSPPGAALPLVLGTIVSQTLINLGALAGLGALAVTTSVASLGWPAPSRTTIIAAAATIVVAAAAPFVVRATARFGLGRLRRTQAVLAQARTGLAVFRSPQPHRRGRRRAGRGLDPAVAVLLGAARRVRARPPGRRRRRGGRPLRRQRHRGRAGHALEHRRLPGRVRRGPRRRLRRAGDHGARLRRRPPGRRVRHGGADGRPGPPRRGPHPPAIALGRGREHRMSARAADRARTLARRAVRAPAARPLALAVLVIGVLAALASTHARPAAATVGVLGDAHPAWLVVLLGLAAVGPLLHGGLLRAGQATVGARFGRWEAIRVAAGIHAANLAAKSGGAAGLAVLLVGHRDPAVGGAARSAAYVLGREIAHVCFAAVVLVALALVAVDGHVSRLVAAGGALFFASRIGHLDCALGRRAPPGPPAALAAPGRTARARPRVRGRAARRRGAPAAAAAHRRLGARPRRRAHRLAVGLPPCRRRTGRAPTPRSRATASSRCSRPSACCPPASARSTPASSPTLHHSGTTLAAAAAAVLLFRVAELWVPLLAGARPALSALRPRPVPAAPVPVA